MKRSILNSPRLLELKKKKQRIFLNKIFLSMLALFFILAGLAYVSRIPKLNISEVKIAGNKAAEAEMLKNIVEKKIAGNYFWFLPRTNIFFYPKSGVENKLREEFKSLKDIKLSIERNGMLKVSIAEREAKYTWCDLVAGLPSDAKKEQCYFMDEDGYIFAEAPYFSGEVFLKFYGSAGVGTYFLKDNFKKFIYFKNMLVAMRIQPVSLHVLDDGDIKIFLFSSNKMGIEPYIILKTDSDFQNAAENLETALATEPLQSNFRNKYASLEYIDLRFGNKVYYKFTK